MRTALARLPTEVKVLDIRLGYITIPIKIEHHDSDNAMGLGLMIQEEISRKKKRKKIKMHNIYVVQSLNLCPRTKRAKIL